MRPDGAGKGASYLARPRLLSPVYPLRRLPHCSLAYFSARGHSRVSLSALALLYRQVGCWGLSGRARHNRETTLMTLGDICLAESTYRDLIECSRRLIKRA